jgi:hypothetical protein
MAGFCGISEIILYVIFNKLAQQKRVAQEKSTNNNLRDLYE